MRLWQDTGRSHDQYGLQVACDAAAATAHHIVSQRELEESQGFGVGYGAGSYRDRRSSFGAFPTGYAGSGYGGGSVYGGGSPLMGNSPLGMGAQPIPVPGSPYAAMGGGVPYVGSLGSIGSYPSSYGGHVGSYGGLYASSGYEVGGLQAGYPMGGYASMPSSPQTIILPPPEGRRHRHRHHHHHHRRHRSHDRYS